MENSYSHVNNGSFLECKVTYDRVANDGMLKKVTEPYIVKAVSFTDAETTIIDYITPFTSGDFLVKDIKRCKFTKIIMDKSSSRYYKCSLDYITVNEKKRYGKKNSQPDTGSGWQCRRGHCQRKEFHERFIGGICHYKNRRDRHHGCVQRNNQIT